MTITIEKLEHAIEEQKNIDINWIDFKMYFWRAHKIAKRAEAAGKERIMTLALELRKLIAQQIVAELSADEIDEFFTKYANFVRKCAA